MFDPWEDEDYEPLPGTPEAMDEERERWERLDEEGGW